MAIIQKPYKNKSRNILTESEKLQKQASLAAAEGSEGMVVNDDGTITVELEDETLAEDTTTLGSYDLKSGHYANLVTELDEGQLLKLAQQVINNVQNDEHARSEWMDTIEFGLDLLGVRVEEKSVPFVGACSAQHPLLMESAVKFQSKASNELLPANGPVKTKVLGDVTAEREQQANRVKAHMNYQILEEMTEFYPDSERLLLYTPLVGSGFKKTYYNSHLERPCSEFVQADLLLVPNSAPDLFRADRYTHILFKTEDQLEEDCAAGLYHKPEGGLGAPQDAKITDVQKKTAALQGMNISINDRDKVYTFYEQHLSLCLEGLDERDSKYKLASPYVVTVDSGSQTVVGIRRNWAEDDKKRKKKVPFTHYLFVPSFNFYGYGFLHLLGNLQLTLTACLRSLVDAGQFATMQGGFKLKGVRITDDGTPIHPGQFKDIETAVMDINKAIMHLPFKEPSNVLFQMLNFIDAKGHKFADSADQLVADSANYGPVGTTMALLEASNKFFSAIHKRLHAAQKNELKILAAINYETLPDNLEYNIENETMRITREDYGPNVDVVPVSDPNISSNAHRLTKANALYEMAMRAPEIHNMREVLKHVYVNMDYEHIDKILPQPEEAQQNDPMTDLQSAVQGKPIKAFPGQDHKAHVMLKQAFLQDPMSGQNPFMQKAAVALQANIQEHMLLQFMESVQAQAQQQQQQMPPEQAMAQAAQQVAQLNIQNLQQQVEAAKQSPKDQATMLLAKAELMDTETQQRKQAFDEKHKTADLFLKQEKIKLEKFKEMNRSVESRAKLKQSDASLTKVAGLDAMIQGMSQSYEAKQKEADRQHQLELKRIETEKKKNDTKPRQQ